MQSYICNGLDPCISPTSVQYTVQAEYETMPMSDRPLNKRGKHGDTINPSPTSPNDSARLCSMVYVQFLT